MAKRKDLEGDLLRVRSHRLATAMRLRLRTGVVVLLGAAVTCASAAASSSAATGVCLRQAQGAVAKVLDVRPTAIRTAKTVGDNEMPQCVFSTRGASRTKPRVRVTVTLNVDDGPQAAWRLMRTVVEQAQLFGPAPPGWVAPIGLYGLGPYASWFPNRDELMASNHVDLFTANIGWRHATRPERIALGRAAVTPYVHHRGNVDAHVASIQRAMRTTMLPGTSCPAFPADNVWNTPITGLPVNRYSSAWLAHMDAGSTLLHPDYGPGGGANPYGIPWQVTSRHPTFVRLQFEYADESDRGPYPLSAATPIEGGQSASGDRHALMVEPATCRLYELYDARYVTGGQSTAGSGAIWSLRSNRLRPAGWTSADAAGLPILPGLVNYDEVRSGRIDHAIRFTAQTTSTRYLWPARHEAGSTASPDYPPMGARFRLRAGFSLPASRCAHACQVVITAMKTYGLILADNGSNWFFQGTADRRWTYTMVDQLKAIPASAFVAVDESCLMVSSNSGQARQPGTGSYDRACGRRGRAGSARPR